MAVARKPFGADHAPLASGNTQTFVRNPRGRLNLLFITADDLGYNSLGCTGCSLPDISPNLDRLAGEGLLIEHCHIATPICGPSRAAWITGTWPHHNGLMGHYNQPPKWFSAAPTPDPKSLRPEERYYKAYLNRQPPQWFGGSPVTATLPELLRAEAGYYTGLVCKSPDPRGWDFEATHLDTGLGRDPSKFEQITRAFIESAVQKGKPFFLHANSMDPHEYWALHFHETKAWIDMMMGGTSYETYPNGKPYPDPSRTYSKDQIPVPPCWPDNDAMRADLVHYFNSVHRLDETVGAILRALRASGEEENTLILFCSDHGIGRAFAKWSMYPMGTRTSLLVKWPGVVAPNRRDRENVFSAIDIAATVLEAAGVAVPEFMDARSFLGLLRDPRAPSPRETVFTCFNYMNNYPEHDTKYPTYMRDLFDKFDNYRPQRAMHSTRYTYIWNAWADGKNEIPLEMSSHQTIREILRATGHGDRADFETFRAREELYDTVNDPGCLVNLIHDPAHASEIITFRRELLKVMEGTNDHETANFRADVEPQRNADQRG